MTRARAALFAALALLACGEAAEPPAHSVEVAVECAAPAATTPWLVERDRRFCAVVAARAGPGGARRLVATVRPVGGWKLADAFPHRLELDGPAGTERVDVGPPPGDHLDLALSLDAAASPRQGRLVFGVCLSDGPCDRIEASFRSPSESSHIK